MAKPPYEIEFRQSIIDPKRKGMYVNEKAIRRGELLHGLEGIVDYAQLELSFSQGAMHVELQKPGGGTLLYRLHGDCVRGNYRELVYKFVM